MRFLCVCALLLAVLATTCEGQLPSCMQDIQQQALEAQRASGNEQKRLACKLARNTIDCMNEVVDNPNIPAAQRSQLRSQLDEARRQVNTECAACGGPAFVFWMLALPLAAYLRQHLQL